MSVNFPNASRSFDERNNRVCFWGYDRTIEISFFVDVEVLERICECTGSTKAEYLKAFDEALDRIYNVADHVYDNASKGKGAYSYTLSADDF